MFAEFDWEPLAAASIGQTYRARLHTGEAVVVKVQRPDIEEMMERDLAALALLADLAQRRTTFGQGVRSGEMLAQFAEGLRAELDFRHEADAMAEMALLLGERSTVRVPKVYRQLSGRRVLVQERFEGVTVSRHPRTRRATSIGPTSPTSCCGRRSIRSCASGCSTPTRIPGNVFALPDGTLGLIDFGAVGRLDPIQQSAIVDMMVALARRDVSLLRDGVERIADLSDTTSPEQLERALARLMAEHVRPGGTVDPAVMEDLVAMLSRFGMRLPTDVVLLVAGAGHRRRHAAHALPRDLSLVAAATELVDAGAGRHRSSIRKELGSRRAAGDGAAPAAAARASRSDPHAHRPGRAPGAQHRRRGQPADRADARQPPAARARRGSRSCSPSALLLVASTTGPLVAGETGLFDIFGYGGLLLGVVLVLRVVAAVARDGTT